MQLGGRYHALAKERRMLLRCESLEPPMSQLGHKPTQRHHRALSVLPPKADIERHDWHVRFVPKADSCTAP